MSANRSKYSEKVNIKDKDKRLYETDDINIEKQENPFRMKKTNILWEKAKKTLSGEQLANIYADLKVHDNKEARLKKSKAENSDKDGLKEAEVLVSYNKILRTYNLEERHVQRDFRFDNEIPYDDDEKTSVQFEDRKLRGMWRRAQDAGFSDEDLKILKEEFWHQQMRINEFSFMSREIETMNPAPSDNNVEIDDMKVKTNLSPEEKEQQKIALKKQNKEIIDGYLKLELLQSKFTGVEPEFKDSRVSYLWALAKKTNWSEDELESFRDELKHFETRLAKRDYFDDQLSFHGDSLEVKSDKIKHLEERRDYMHHTVKKVHGDIKVRLEKALRHTEL